MRLVQPSIFLPRKPPAKAPFPGRNIARSVLVLLAFCAVAATVTNGAEPMTLTATRDLNGARPAETIAVPPVPATPPAGSVSLWNGRDLSGWVVFLKNNASPPPEFFKASDDGVLRFAANSTGYARTRQSFTNYHLHVEYRWPDKIANSGIFVHVRAPDALWPYSAQSNLRLDMSGDLIPQGGFTFNGSTETVKKSGAFNEKPAGEWNGCDIFCREDSIEVFVNGERKNFVEKISANSGGIALQLEGAPIEFRNLWLQELAPPKKK